MAEVSVVWGIFVLGRKRNGSDYEAHGIIRVEVGVLQFQNIVIVGYAVAVAGHLYTLNTHLAGEVC